MPRPVINGIWFGGRTIPNVGGTAAYVDLTTGGWSPQDFQLGGLARALSVSQQVWRQRTAVMSDDRGARALAVPMIFKETSKGLSQAVAALSQLGEQNLVFDNTSTGTYLRAYVKDRGTPRMKKKFSPYWWDLVLSFLVTDGYPRDIVQTAQTGIALAGTVGGSSTAFNVTYNGDVFALPQFVIRVTNANPATISSIVLTNTTSGEALTIVFPSPLAATTAWTITIDTEGLTVTDLAGTQYDFSGAFPALYPPYGTVNAFTCVVTTGAGTLSNATLEVDHNPRWELP